MIIQSFPLNLSQQSLRPIYDPTLRDLFWQHLSEQLIEIYENVSSLKENGGISKP